jgi:hypothetical protein
MSFIAPEPTALLLLALDEDGYCFGHCLCLSEKWFGLPAVTVVQLQVDDGYTAPKELWKEGAEQVVYFSWQHQAIFMQAATRSKAAARLFSRWGFKQDKYLLRREAPSRVAPLSRTEG